jgi:hypothetical protein
MFESPLINPSAIVSGQYATILTYMWDIFRSGSWLCFHHQVKAEMIKRDWSLSLDYRQNQSQFPAADSLTKLRLWKMSSLRPSITGLPVFQFLCNNKTKLTKLHGLSPRVNYTDRATAACRRSDCQLLQIEGATWSAWRIPTAVFSVF